MFILQKGFQAFQFEDLEKVDLSNLVELLKSGMLETFSRPHPGKSSKCQKVLYSFPRKRSSDQVHLTAQLESNTVEPSDVH